MSSTLFEGAVVLTLDDAVPQASSILVKDGRISWVGQQADVADVIGPHTQRVDLAGATVVPGFIDAHHHLMTLGYWMSQIDCSSPRRNSIADILTAVEERRP